MDSVPGNDAVPAGKLKHKPTAPAVTAGKHARRAKTPTTDIEASGPGDQAHVSRSQQEAAAVSQISQDEEALTANGSAVAKDEGPIATLHSTAAAGNVKRAKEVTVPTPSDGTIGRPSTAGMLSTADNRITAGKAAVGQLSIALNAKQSPGTLPTIQESLSATEAAAGMAPKAPDIAAATDTVDPAVPVKQTPGNPGLAHQTRAPAHPAPGPPSSSSPTAAPEAALNGPGPTLAALAASSHQDAPAPAGISPASALGASALPMAESAKTTAAAQETTAPAAQCDVHGIEAPVEGAVRRWSEPAQGFQAQQQSPAEMAAVAAAPAEATVAAALANNDAVVPLDQAAAVQVNRAELQCMMIGTV